METNAYKILRHFWHANGVPEDTSSALEETLTKICDEENFSPRVYSSPADAVPRTVLDLQAISVKDCKATQHRIVQFGSGVNLIYGPNGCGKSTLLDAIAFGIGGRASLTTKPQNLVRHGQSKAEVELVCSDMTLRRTVSNETEPPEYTLSVEIGGDKSSKFSEAERLLQSYLGVNPSFVRRACLVKQGDVTSLLDEEPGERRAFVLQLLGLDACEDTRTVLARALKIRTDAQKNRESIEEKRQAAVQALYGLDLNPAKALVEAAAQSGGAAEAKRLETRIATIRSEIASMKRSETGMAVAVAELDKLNKELAQLPMIPETDITVASKNEREGSLSVLNLSSQLEALKNQGHRLAKLPAGCPTCAEMGVQCPATPAVKNAKLADLRKEYIEVQTRLSAAQKVHAGFVEALKRAEAQNSAARSVSVKRDKLHLAQDSYKSRIADYSANQHPKTIPELEAELEQAEKKLVTAQAGGVDPGELAKAQNVIAAHSHHTAHLEWCMAELAKLMTNETEIAHLRTLVECFSKTGLPLWIAEQHVDGINRIAAELADGDAYVYRFTHNLDIDIQQAEVSIDPRLACESARQRGALILRAAMGRYLQEVAGVTIPILWIDEISYQDDISTASLIATVQRMARHFSKVIFATSRWDPYIGAFENEISLCPKGVVETSQELIEKLEELKNKDEGKPIRKPRRRTTKAESEEKYDEMAAKIMAAQANEDPTPPAAKPEAPKEPAFDGALDDELPF